MTRVLEPFFSSFSVPYAGLFVLHLLIYIDYRVFSAVTSRICQIYTHLDRFYRHALLANGHKKRENWFSYVHCTGHSILQTEKGNFGSAGAFIKQPSTN